MILNKNFNHPDQVIRSVWHLLIPPGILHLSDHLRQIVSPDGPDHLPESPEPGVPELKPHVDQHPLQQFRHFHKMVREYHSQILYAFGNVIFKETPGFFVRDSLFFNISSDAKNKMPV